MKSSVFRLGLLAAVSAVVVAVVIQWGNAAGRAQAAAEKERLLIVWPDLMTWSQNDRMVVVALSERCHLRDEAMARVAILSCLRRAAREGGDPLHGVQDLPGELERLILRAK